MLENKLISILKNLTGSLVVFGVDNDKIINAIDNNQKITFCDLLNCNYQTKGKKGRSKYIKSIRKKYKKKRIETMIINLDKATNYTRKLVKDSVYITKNNIYLYGNLDDIDMIVKKYQRYNIEIKKTDYKDKCLITIDVTLAKNNMIKDFFYYIIDTFSLVFDKIGDLMS